MGVSPLYGLFIASRRRNHIHVKIDKVKLKPCIHQNYYVTTASIYKSSLILVNFISCILIYLAQAIMGYRTQYFKHLWRHGCLSLRIHHGVSCTKSSNCSNKIKMPKKTTGSQIKGFILIGNMNIEKLISTKSNPNNFSQDFLKWIQKSASLHCLLPPTHMFSFL